MTMKMGLTAGLCLMFAAPALAQDHTPANSEIAVPAPPEGKGQIVFFRAGSMVGMAMGCQVNEGEGEPSEAKVSSLGNGRYFILQADPGTHEFWVRNEKKDELTLLVEPDETQFVECKIKMGIMSGRPDIRPSDGERFAEKSGGMKLVDDDDMKAEGVLRAADLGVAPD
jgi:hypothetical protein